MKYLLFCIFVVVPIAEIAMFIQVGDVIGLWPTIAIIIVTAFLGTALLRFQGLATLARAQGALNAGELPLESVIHGVFLLIAGLLLLTPGFITDFVGFLLFIPPLRLGIAQWVIHKFKNAKNIHIHQTFTAGSSTPTAGPGKPTDAPIIEGDFTIAEDETDVSSRLEETPEKGPSTTSPWKQ